METAARDIDRTGFMIAVIVSSVAFPVRGEAGEVEGWRSRRSITAVLMLTWARSLLKHILIELRKFRTFFDNLSNFLNIA